MCRCRCRGEKLPAKKPFANDSSGHPPPGQRLTLVATGEKAFKAIGAPISITFQVEGDKIAGFTLTQGANPGTVYTRVEGK